MNSNDPIVKLELSDLSKAVQELAKNSDVKIKDIKPSSPLYQSLEMVRLISSLLYDTNHYSLVIDVIKQQPKPKVIIPGTIGGFLFGCFLDNYGDVNNHLCSSLCVDAIPPKEQDKINFCPYQIWIQQDNMFVLLNPSNGQSNQMAYIYVNPDFNGFTPADIEMFNKHGVSMAQVLHANNNQSITGVIPLSELPVEKIKPDPPSIPNIEPQVIVPITPTPVSNNSIVAWLVLLVIIIIILILVVVYLYRHKLPFGRS